MTSKEAIKLLQDAGFSLLRMGKGSHAIFTKGSFRIVIPVGTNLSPRMVGKVRSAIRK